MGLETMVNRKMKQTAVYWGNPVNDGFNHYTFDAPVQIACRWQNKTQVLEGKDGTSIFSRATVFVPQDLEEEGLLYLGTLASLTEDQKNDPQTIEDICIIRRPEKSPILNSSTSFIRKVFLTPWLS